MNPSFSKKLLRCQEWSPPKKWLKVTAIDAHTGGEPLRIVTGGLPPLKGRTILAKRRYMKKNMDHLRRALMWEPRGHADMYGCVVTPPVTPTADFGVIFMHNEGYSTMCGHGIIAVAKFAAETGLVRKKLPETRIQIDSPAGLVTAYARWKNGVVSSVRFLNVPSYVAALDQQIDIPGIGPIRYDLAFGGAYYAFVRAVDVGVRMIGDDYRMLIEKGMAIKLAVMKSTKIVHPFEEDLNFLYGTIFTGTGLTKGAHSRNVCIFAEGEVDRSPTGTGVSARMALHYARGEIKIGETMVIESIVGSRFACRVKEAVRFGPHNAVIPEVEGTANFSGKHEFLIDPADPLKDGFLFR